jgi:hypothetical protein
VDATLRWVLSAAALGWACGACRRPARRADAPAARPDVPLPPIAPAPPWVHLRRIDRGTYEARVRDALLGYPWEPPLGVDLPDEPADRPVSAAFLSAYRRSAWRVADRLIPVRPPPHLHAGYEAEEVDHTGGALSEDGTAWVLRGRSEVHGAVTAGHRGDFRLRLRLWALRSPAGAGPGPVTLLVDGAPLRRQAVVDAAPGVVEATAFLTEGAHTLGVRLDDPATDTGVALDWVDVAGPLSSPPGSHPLRDAFVPCRVQDPLQADCVRQVADRFGRRLWRRPPAPDELDRLAAWLGAAGSTDSDQSLRLLFVAMLLSPAFLFEGGPAPDAADAAIATTDAAATTDAGADR